MTTLMRRTPGRAVPLMLVLGLALWSCNGPNRGTNTQPSISGFLVVVTVTPNVLRVAPPQAANSTNVDGGCGIVTMKVSNTSGQLVDGAQAGISVSLGKLKVGTEDFVTVAGTTTHGLFSVTFCAGDTPGTAIITAVSEDAVATTTATLF